MMSRRVDRNLDGNPAWIRSRFCSFAGEDNSHFNGAATYLFRKHASHRLIRQTVLHLRGVEDRRGQSFPLEFPNAKNPALSNAGHVGSPVNLQALRAVLQSATKQD